jgi:hypothetical protein
VVDSKGRIREEIPESGIRRRRLQRRRVEVASLDHLLLGGPDAGGGRLLPQGRDPLLAVPVIGERIGRSLQLIVQPQICGSKQEKQ